MTLAVYPIGGENVDNRSNLRYSLRTLATNAPDVTDVLLVGDIPDWYTGAAIPTIPHPSKWPNMRQSANAALASAGFPETFYWMNDDIFILEHVDGQLPTHHLGDIDFFLQRHTEWRRICWKTAQWVKRRGVHTHAYGAHAPLLFDSAKLRDVLAAYPAGEKIEIPMTYAITGAGGVGVQAGYGNLFRNSNFDEVFATSRPYIAGQDYLWPGWLADLIQPMYPDPSPWETQ